LLELLDQLAARQVVQTSNVGPAPEIVAPSAPNRRRLEQFLERGRAHGARLVDAVAGPGNQVEVAC
jgi:hypothetical protein